MKQPWELNPKLSVEHLTEVANFIKNIRNDVIDLHDHQLGDSAKGTGLRAYECIRVRLIREAAKKDQWPWLGILKPDGRFTFSINSVPIRMYRGRPETPFERRLIPCGEAVRQSHFLFEEVGEAALIRWFFVVEVDESKYVERISVTGFLNGQQVSCWEVPLNARVPVIAPVSDSLPQPAKQEKAKARIKRKVKETKPNEVG